MPADEPRRQAGPATVSRPRSTAAHRTALGVYRTVQRYPRVLRGVRRLLHATGVGSRVTGLLIDAIQRGHRSVYEKWIAENDTLSEADRRAIRSHIARMARPPLISVVMPAYNTPEKLLREAIESVRAQLYPHWELCIADDASPQPQVGQVLASFARDKRIRSVRRTTNGHISAATNSALALATGEFVALLDHDDILPEHALYEVAAEIEAHPDVDLIYSDEDKIDQAGRRFGPYFKTDWNPELALGQNMVSHLGVYRRTLLEQVGGARQGFEGSQDHDLMLRVADATTPERIRHIPAVLYHWRQQAGPASFSEGALERCAAAARRAVTEHLQRVGEPADVLPIPGVAFSRVRRHAPEPAPLVTAIVPTRDGAALLRRCADGLLRRTDYPAIELLIVDNGSTDPEALALFRQLEADPRVRVLRDDGPFNYSALNNRAAAEARGEILLLLNNDIDVIGPGWLRAMVAQAVRPSVGAVGAKLLYADGTLQHAGVALGVGGNPGVAAHFHPGERRDAPGYAFSLRLARDMSAVTGACLAVRRAVFEQVGGLDAEHLAVAFNDVDFCLRLRDAGYRVIWTPDAELYHLESASRGSDLRPDQVERFAAEVAYMRQRWGEVLDNDPFFGPNFSLASADFTMAASRRVKPWLRAAAG